MLACGQPRKQTQNSRRGETQSLLPRHNHDNHDNHDNDAEDDTPLQRRLHQKMRAIHMARALSAGYMPSTEQAIANLRTLLASELLNPANPELSDVGRLFLRDAKLWIRVLIDLLREKNPEDQIQQFIWQLSRSRATVNISDVADQVSQVGPRTQATDGTAS